MTKKKDYAKALFFFVIFGLATIIFVEIAYIGLTGGLEVNPTAANPVMAWMWLLWATLVPASLALVSFIHAIMLPISILCWEIQD